MNTKYHRAEVMERAAMIRRGVKHTETPWCGKREAVMSVAEAGEIEV